MYLCKSEQCPAGAQKRYTFAQPGVERVREEFLEEMITEQNLRIRGNKYDNKSREGFSLHLSPPPPPEKRSHSVENNKYTD